MAAILFIAKSQSMADLAVQVSRELKLELAVAVGSRKEAAAIAAAYPDCSVYISRGGTAAALRQVQNKTVIELRPALGEILAPVHQLAAQGRDKIAVVASQDLIGENHCDVVIGNAAIYIRPAAAEEFAAILETLKKAGVQGVIGGRAVAELAKGHGMITAGLEVGAAAIRQALQEAAQAVNVQCAQRQQESERVEAFQRCSGQLYSDIERAAAAVQQMAASAQELATTSKGTANVAEHASQEVQRTAEILSMIRHVAQQSSLLGLNAAIEAARVGEQGRGFAVVAEEVRKLANESSSSVRSIEELLHQIRQSVGAVWQDAKRSNIISHEQANANQEIAVMLESLRSVGRNLLELTKEHVHQSK